MLGEYSVDYYRGNMSKIHWFESGNISNMDHWSNLVICSNESRNNYTFMIFRIRLLLGRFSSGYFPCVWILKTDVSEYSVGSIFTGRLLLLIYKPKIVYVYTHSFFSCAFLYGQYLNHSDRSYCKFYYVRLTRFIEPTYYQQTI
jgi:hypothetical protein